MGKGRVTNRKWVGARGEEKRWGQKNGKDGERGNRE